MHSRKAATASAPAPQFARARCRARSAAASACASRAARVRRARSAEPFQRLVMAAGVLRADREVVAAAVDRVLDCRACSQSASACACSASPRRMVALAVGDEAAQREHARLQLDVAAALGERPASSTSARQALGSAPAAPAHPRRRVQRTAAPGRAGRRSARGRHAPRAWPRSLRPARTSNGPSSTQPLRLQVASAQCATALFERAPDHRPAARRLPAHVAAAARGESPRPARHRRPRWQAPARTLRISIRTSASDGVAGQRPRPRRAARHGGARAAVRASAAESCVAAYSRTGSRLP